MSVSLVLLVVMAALYASGIYLLLERSLTRVLLGFLLVGNATNLLILIMAGRAGTAPIVTDGVTPEEMTDPLPQALILTAIVITFSISAFLLALIYRSWRLARQDDLEDDADDVALRSGTLVIPSESAEPDSSDTEFGNRGEAASQASILAEERGTS
ncbi:MAG: Na(+)/H(+) antiporter subunit C [Salinibacterium sp.]|nr:Na(+)/H(+) antiporter subunit C [Salinibacterium sp.]